MNCPICKDLLEYHTLSSSQVTAYQCRKGDGLWISAREYFRWLENYPQPSSEQNVSPDDLPTWNTPKLKICPARDHLILRYRVFPRKEFFLGRCGNCLGVWFDKNEWEAIVARNLHNKVHQFFTQTWQTKIREDEARLMLDKMYRERFGEDDYAKVKTIWEWLKDHPNKGMLVTFLQAKNPYAL